MIHNAVSAAIWDIFQKRDIDVFDLSRQLLTRIRLFVVWRGNKQHATE